ncbi:MAG: hypothetical protein ACI9XO_003634 [Paraglaciecola sp.]|jgi:uncharacterized protein (DUF58 family)
MLFPLALTGFVVAVALVFVDMILLFNPNIEVKVRRRLPKIFSLGDANKVVLELMNQADRNLLLIIIDELPFQFQKRDFEQKLNLAAGESQSIAYELKPFERGEYKFGAVNVFLETQIGLVQRCQRHDHEMSIPVYPSVLQMKQYSIMAFDRMTTQKGIKKIRRIGHSYEFEQIKNYVRGDDYRSVNWKATSRRNELMVNQFEDERAQQVYCIIDKSRAMKMPFEGLSLMDYAINTSLVISNIALQKHDKAGLITFSDKIGTTLKAEQKGNQLNKILHALYNEKERDLEANYQILYQVARRLINGRSLILLYTNFESSYALDRVLPILRRINKLHMLVVVFFENTEIRDFVDKEVTNMEGIYTQTVAQNFLAEKSAMVQKLRQYGIQAVLTRPEDLSVNTINKYLELKSRGLI